ncbi:cardiolipin synthase (CMP-forming) [Microcaecilia unicolor]|uniref:Cardiolipin synthase (CMP-forming) n=1 Tax=Microcaecilia unicolor TaxID=1415580 RepID=A0A6P7XNF7_9AMPH|nr:cardiolipin synthase (CMP-forming) [Microcaecilia unicolor]
MLASLVVRGSVVVLKGARRQAAANRPGEAHGWGAVSVRHEPGSCCGRRTVATAPLQRAIEDAPCKDRRGRPCWSLACKVIALPRKKLSLSARVLVCQALHLPGRWERQWGSIKFVPGLKAWNLPERLRRSEKPGNRIHSDRRFSELYENPWTIPNLLCMARIGLSPILGYLIVEEDFAVALGVFALAGLTDLLDGYIARNWANQKSVLGSALDPLADKILISVLYVCLTYTDLIPVLLTSMIILRDIALIGAVFYVRYKTLPPPRTLSKYFNPCYATAQLKPTLISKMNTAIQLILVAASLAAPVFNYVDSVYLEVLWYITACTTAASGYSYYHYGHKTVKVLKK